ncbi:hypothetical protein AJ80_02690 [Polytolypa hystricis UAMH7299]|uniref:Altered inheritance of mitochondria protein 9, mitochondrial n=1 Tax=Polytolypa hystricis (strain UAMH7299) TaxID=1447883 RepID=A0A2B7YGR5_POLH7|nr:hypothetical protein AJ80_02690 [Polytolypa hystricis UAMH7299]
MDNGVQVVARTPNPYLPPTVATASEVATLDFLRNELNIPVPRVLAWSSDKDQPVGVEHIIMEKAAGEELGKSWPSMDISDRLGLVSQLANIQAKISSVDFKYYGTERRSMDEYKGPWPSPISYAEDIAKREMNWISRFAKPRDLSDPLRQSTSQEYPNCHLQILNQYLKILPQVIPSDHDLYRSTIWHSNLHSGNIFVENNKIVSIINWQCCMSVPLFLACKIPKFLKVDGPPLFDLPPAAGLSAQEKKETLLKYQLTQLQRFYISKLKDLDSSIFRALSYPHAIIRQQFIDFAGSTWEDDGLFLFREMMHQKTWGNQKEVFDALGIPIDGWVHSEDFKFKAETMRNPVAEILSSADDQEEIRRALRAWKLSDPGSTHLSPMSWIVKIISTRSIRAYI